MTAMSATTQRAPQSAKRAAHQAADSTPVEWMARIGLVSRGVIWFAIGALALAVAAGHNKEADRQGALRTIADKPFGHTVLVVLTVGFSCYALWRVVEAIGGHRDEEGAKRLAKALASLARAGLYAFFAVSTIRFLASGSGGHGDNAKPLTARVMAHSGGQTIVGIVGLCILVGGLAIAVRGVRAKFLDLLRPLGRVMHRITSVVGRVGLVGRGLVIALVGSFILHAAWTFDPHKAKGLDQSLKTLAGQPYGGWLLAAAALGLVSYAVWSFIEAAYRKV